MGTGNVYHCIDGRNPAVVSRRSVDDVFFVVGSRGPREEKEDRPRLSVGNGSGVSATSVVEFYLAEEWGVF